MRWKGGVFLGFFGYSWGWSSSQIVPVIFALCSDPILTPSSDGDGRRWDDAVLALFSPRLAALGKMEFRDGAFQIPWNVLGFELGSLRWHRCCHIPRAEILGSNSNWNAVQVETSSPLDVSCLPGAFPIRSGLALVFFGTREGFEAFPVHSGLGLVFFETREGLELFLFILRWL